MDNKELIDYIVEQLIKQDIRCTDSAIVIYFHMPERRKPQHFQY